MSDLSLVSFRNAYRNNKGHGVTALQLFTETNHYEALAREYAMIKALGLNNLSNKNNSSPYGIMKNFWNNTEVTNFGNMILYNTFKMTTIEKPAVIYPFELKVKSQTHENKLS